MKTKHLITVLAFMAMTTLLGAQDIPRGQRLLNGTGKGPAYVDNNKNNVCDNYENQKPAAQRGGRNFNARGPRQDQGQCQRLGPRGTGQGRGQGPGNNRNFVDADKNGICDYRETPAKK